MNKTATAAAIVAIVCSLPLSAQWTIRETVRLAGERYPSIQASSEQAVAAAAGVRLARTAYLPKGDAIAQLNRATRNNVFGMVLPNPVLPSISGPPLAANAGTNVWGSSIGFLVNWEPFDLGLRSARVDTASAAQRRAEKAVARTRFDVETAAADAYLTVLAADEMVKSAKAALERAQTIAALVKALVDSELRPGADFSRARAESATAEGQVIQAEQAAQVARINLAQFTGSAPNEVNLSAPFAARMPTAPVHDSGQAHPVLLERQAAVDETQFHLKELDKTWRPRFLVQSALYARGTGANPDGTTGGGASGLGPNIYNWGAGFSVLFPLFDLPRIRAEKEAGARQVAGAEAEVRKTEVDLRAQRQRAEAALDGARRMARIAPIQVESARAAETQARARYEAGLSSLNDLAESQRLLFQSEVDDSLARLAVWRALLAAAAAQGDLQPFLELTEKR